MKSWVLCLAMLTAVTAVPVFAQDHSQHTDRPTTATPPPVKPEGVKDEHAEHAKDLSEHRTAEKESLLSEERHIPPDPPEHLMADMSEARMRELMEMDDAGRVGSVVVDQLEGFRDDGRTALSWDAQAWYGDDYHKVWMKTEGERAQGKTEAANAELLWNRIFARWWSVQAGVRHDFGEGPTRTWAAIGVEGLAPYWFDVEATMYVGEESRAAARVKVEYEVLFTQRLILQPEVEANLYSKDDPERGIGAGLSDIELGLRLRYELRREIAPYVGVSFTRSFSDTAELARATGKETSEARVVAGLRVWF